MALCPIFPDKRNVWLLNSLSIAVPRIATTHVNNYPHIIVKHHNPDHHRSRRRHCRRHC